VTHAVPPLKDSVAPLSNKSMISLKVFSRCRAKPAGNPARGSNDSFDFNDLPDIGGRDDQPRFGPAGRTLAADHLYSGHLKKPVRPLGRGLFSARTRQK
jgi:hypothetical protein